MIGYVRGIVTHLFKESCYVDIHGVGVPYVPTTTRQQLIEGQEATLFTYLNVQGRCDVTIRILEEDEYMNFLFCFSFLVLNKGRLRHIVRHRRQRLSNWLLLMVRYNN